MKIVLKFLIPVLIAASPLAAQGFEGKIESRNISVDIGFLEGNENELPNPEQLSEKNMNFDPFAAPNYTDEQINKFFSLTSKELRELVKQKGGFEEGNDYVYQESKAVLWIKGTKIRVDTEEDGEKVSLLYDLNNREIKVVQWGEQIVIKINLDSYQKKIDESMGLYEGDKSQSAEKPAALNLSSAGKKAKINGFDCELFTGKGSNENPKYVWLHKNIDRSLIESFTNMLEITSAVDPSEFVHSEANFYFDQNAIPIQEREILGSEMTIDEILSIAKMSVSSDKFIAPKGFKETTLEEMMNQGWE